MNITFEPLNESHFPLLLKWLEAPHVKSWWSRDVKWTPELIWEKYGTYVKGYKRFKLQEQMIEKPMHAYIICMNQKPIGYIQYYSAHDFPHEQGYETSDLPQSCAALDWYIGEPEFTGKGIGSKALEICLKLHVFKHFDHVFVDPDTANTFALRAYEKAGFKTIKKVNNGKITWMLRTCSQKNISMNHCISIKTTPHF